MSPERSRWAEGALLLITVIWGTTFPLLRTSLHVLDPWDIVALRFSIAAVLIAVIYRKRFARVNRLALRDGLITGAFMGAGYLTQAIGLTTESSPRSAFLTGTAVLFVPFLDRFISKLGVSVGEWIGIAMVVVGLFFYAGPGLAFRAGDVWTLLGALMFACQVVTTNVAARRSDPFVVSGLQSAVAACIGWVFVGAAGGPAVPWSEMPWIKLLYFGVIATALILVLQTWALGKTKPVRAGVIYSLEPVFASVFALAFFGEGMTRWEVLGSAAILLGVLIAELKKR